MRIEREKFFALTATMAGFWPNAPCAIAFGAGPAPAGTNAGRTTSHVGDPPVGADTPGAERTTCAKLRP